MAVLAVALFVAVVRARPGLITSHAAEFVFRPPAAVRARRVYRFLSLERRMKQYHDWVMSLPGVQLLPEKLSPQLLLF